MNNLDPKIFYFELPLYTKVDIAKDLQNFKDLLNFTGRIDGYSPKLKENTTYQIKTLIQTRKIVTSVRIGTTMADHFLSRKGFDYSEIICLRSGEVFYVFYHLNLSSDEFMKIGQYPSIADLHISKIKNYDKILTKEQLKEFTRGIGLAANGVGIGSFVYLRRIFEDLIDEAREKADKEGLDVTNYNKIRMDET